MSLKINIQDLKADQKTDINQAEVKKPSKEPSNNTGFNDKTTFNFHPSIQKLQLKVNDSEHLKKKNFETIKTPVECQNQNQKEYCLSKNETINTSRPNFVKKLESFVASMEVKNDYKVISKNNRNQKSFNVEFSPCQMSQRGSSTKESSEYFRPLDLTTRKMEANMSYISSNKIKNNSAINELEKKFGQKSKLFEYIGLNNNNIAPSCWAKNLKRNLLTTHQNTNFLDNYFKRNLNYSPKNSHLSPSFSSFRNLRKFPRNNQQQNTGSISPNQSKDLVTSSSSLTEECSSTLEHSPIKNSHINFKSNTEHPLLSSLSCYTCHQRFKSYLDLTLHMIQANHYDNLVHSLHNNDSDIRPTSSSSTSSTEEVISNFDSPLSRSSIKNENDKVDKKVETNKIEDIEDEKDENEDEDEKLAYKKRKITFEYDCNESNLKKEQMRSPNKAAFNGQPVDNDIIKGMLSNADPHNANQYMAWQHLLWNFLKDKECQPPMPPPFLLLPWINAHLYSSMLNLIQQNNKLLKCLPVQQPILPTNPYHPLISRNFQDSTSASKESYAQWNCKTNFQYAQNLKNKLPKTTMDHSALRQLEGMVYGEKNEKKRILKNQTQHRNITRTHKGLDEWVDKGRTNELPPPLSSTTSPPAEKPISVIDKFYKYQQLANDLSSKTK